MSKSLRGAAPWRSARRGRGAAREATLVVSAPPGKDERYGDARRAPTKVEAYICSRGHRTELTFAADAEVPPTWGCSTCHQEAMLDGQPDEVTDHTERAPKEHREQLHERRTVAELEALLEEQLNLLRSGTLQPVSRYLGRLPHIYGA